MQCGLQKTGNVRPIRVGLCAANPVVHSCRRSTADELRQAQAGFKINVDGSNRNDRRLHL